MSTLQRVVRNGRERALWLDPDDAYDLERDVRAHVLAQAPAVLEVITHHRRMRNVRECTGCDWRPAQPGGTDNPEAVRRRHADFNAHLAELAVQAVAR